MHAVEIDVADPASIATVSPTPDRGITPALNVLINNAGIMRADNAATVMDDAQTDGDRHHQPARPHPDDRRRWSSI